MSAEESEKGSSTPMPPWCIPAIPSSPIGGSCFPSTRPARVRFVRFASAYSLGVAYTRPAPAPGTACRVAHGAADGPGGRPVERGPSRPADRAPPAQPIS
ncbi:hypothetical protein GCM10018781_23550 [Kitasatospora indigofera]|uniref:Uncharacterized protein n=1 Tax=Kitasatospora indigofera TaxID=67307 RepID=A0A919KPB6_9ACTN|nr:hypothetical protein GCM10018781_23550 [Kitasatospora indigofera]